jgi:hypothetical protein
MSRPCKPRGANGRSKSPDTADYKLVISMDYLLISGVLGGFQMVLLLLLRGRVLRPLSFAFLAVACLSMVAVGAGSAGAAQRTFVLTPADLVAAADLFGAKALSRSASLKKSTVGLKRGALRFAKGVCPSLLADPTRKLTRIRILGGPLGAPLVVGRSLATGLTTALTAMNAASWLPPASGFTNQPHWVTEPFTADVIAFSTAGFAVGNQIGALGQGDAANRVPGFRFTVDLANALGTGPAEIAIALTTELPPTKIGKPGKRTECILVASLLPVDIQALRDLVTPAPLTNVTKNRLNFILNNAQTFLDRGAPDRAARNARTFTLEVAQRTKATQPATESPIASAFAEPMINRGNATSEALCLDLPSPCPD